MTRIWDELLHSEEKSVWVDEGDISAERDAAFRKDGNVWGVMRKAPTTAGSPPLTKRSNRMIAEVRVKVECPFWVMKS